MSVHSAEIAIDHEEGSEEISILAVRGKMSDNLIFGREFAGKLVQGCLSFACRLPEVDCLCTGNVISTDLGIGSVILIPGCNQRLLAVVENCIDCTFKI